MANNIKRWLILLDTREMQIKARVRLCWSALNVNDFKLQILGTKQRPGVSSLLART